MKSQKILSFLTVVLVMVGLAVITYFNSNDPSATAAQNTQADRQVSSASTSSGGERQPQDAPDFSLETMEGEPFVLSDHEGKIVVLNIWATWCPPCREEIPDFIDIQKEMKDEGVLFAGVSVDKEGWSVVRPFAKKMGINYPIMVDDGTVYKKYGPFRGIPTTFIINKKGKVEYSIPGMVTKDKLKPVLEKLASR